jgi:hypothetical protein
MISISGMPRTRSRLARALTEQLVFFFITPGFCGFNNKRVYRSTGFGPEQRSRNKIGFGHGLTGITITCLTVT